MPSCSLEDAEIHYETRGAGRPIVMLPGRPSDRRIMMRLMEPAFDEDSPWLRIYPDLPGTGQSPRVPLATHDAMVATMLAFIDHMIGDVIGDARFAIAGFSYGGYLTRGVVAARAAHIDGAMFCVPQVTAVLDPARLPAARAIVADPAIAAGLGGVASMVVIQTPAVAAAVREVLAEVAIADHAFNDQLEVAGPAAFEADNRVVLDAPALIMTARQDALCGYADAWAMLAQFPRASFATLDSAGHFIAIEQPALCHALIRDWLARLAT
jgi:pimeloyl-ACP methyl ester carboxylesterase